MATKTEVGLVLLFFQGQCVLLVAHCTLQKMHSGVHIPTKIETTICACVVSTVNCYSTYRLVQVHRKVMRLRGRGCVKLQCRIVGCVPEPTDLHKL